MFNRFKARRASNLSNVSAGGTPVAATPTASTLALEPTTQVSSSSSVLASPIASSPMSAASTPMSSASMSSPSNVQMYPAGGYPPSYGTRTTRKARAFAKRRGWLEVAVLEGNGLVRRDMLSKSDPYCTLRIKSKGWAKLVNPFKSYKSTKVINNNPNPVWNQTFRFRVKHADLDFLKIRVYDSDPGKDDIIGKQWIPLSTLIEGQATHMIVPLVPASSGTIHLCLVARGFGLPAPISAAPMPMMLPAATMAPAPFIERPTTLPPVETQSTGFLPMESQSAGFLPLETQSTGYLYSQKAPIVTEQLIFPPEQILSESRRLSSVGPGPMYSSAATPMASSQIGAY